MSLELGELLVSSGALTQAQLREATAHQRNGDRTLPEALLDLALCDEITVYRAVAKQNGMPFVDLDKGKPNPAVLERVPSEVATDQGILPLMEKGGKLIVAVDDPFKRIVADQLSFLIGGEVACALATPSAHARAMKRFYGAGEGEEDVARAMSAGVGDEGDDAPIVRLVTRPTRISEPLQPMKVR